MSTPKHSESKIESQDLLNYLNSTLDDYEKQMRVPQAPAELKKKTNMYHAINSAINIVKKTKVTSLGKHT